MLICSVPKVTFFLFDLLRASLVGLFEVVVVVCFGLLLSLGVEEGVVVVVLH